MDTTLYATIVLMCDLGIIRVTVDSSVDLTGMHCVGWCTNYDMSVVEDYTSDIKTGWDAVNVDGSSTHIILLVAVPDWQYAFYAANSIVWYADAYYYTPSDTYDEPGQVGSAWVLAPIDSPDFAGQWSYVIADPATYDALTLSNSTKTCDVVTCNSNQAPTMRLPITSAKTQTNVYFVYSDDGSVYVTSNKYPNSSSYSSSINVENCKDYTVYDFNTPGWSESVPNVIGDIVNVYTLGGGGYQDVRYYYCIADTSLSPVDDPSSWKEITLSSEDFETYWSTLINSTPDIVYVRHIVVDCSSWQILATENPPTVSCEELTTSFGGGYTINFNGNDVADIYYYTFIAYDGKVELPSSYNTSNGAYSFDMQCGIEYDVNTFIVPKYVHNEKKIYATGSIIIYNGRLYSALYDTHESPGTDPSAWFLVSSDFDKYDESMYPYFEPILDDCYLGPTGSITSIVSCPCTRYDIGMSYAQYCNEGYVAITPSATLNGAAATDCTYAIFVFSDGALVDSYASASMVGSSLANGTYDVYVACVPNWNIDDIPYESGSIVWYDDSFWIASTETSQEPFEPSMKGPMAEWSKIGITSGDFTTYWEHCGEGPIPTNIENYGMTVSCSSAKSMMSLSSSYYYTCGGSMLNGDFAVSQSETTSPCYAIVLMIYGLEGSTPTYYIIGSPTVINTSIPLDNGEYQIETYVIPCWSAGSYDTGEIVLYNESLWISDVDENSSEPGIDSNWIKIETPLIPETIVTIKDPEYPGEATYALDYLTVVCEDSTSIEYVTSLDLDCTDLSIDVRFNANISAVQFAFISWLFDVTGFSVPLSQISSSDFTNPVTAPSIINCHGGDDSSLTYLGLSNNHAYAVLSLAIPHYVFGYSYNPGQLAFYNGDFWQVDPGGSSTTSQPSTPDWIKIYSPGDDCSNSYWNNFVSYIADVESEYSNSVAVAEFDCIAKDDASEYDMSHAQVNSADASFALIRTNPALTGNINITVDTAGGVWFNSIDSSEDLAKDQYKHYPVDITKSHPANVYAFFDKGKTPGDIVFKVKNDVDPTVMTNRYEDQFDFSLYYGGVKYMKSKYYDEKFSYFAPLYLKNVVPEYFVIFKISDPLNMPIDQLKSYSYDQTDYMYELFKRATLIKSFDLSNRTKIGKYIRSIISDPMFPKSPLSVNFASDGMTSWNGLSVASGTWNSKGELMYDIYCDDDPLKYFEKYITDGYRRHGVIFPNIINLEFLFDDETSAEFDFNRYIGFYVNATALEKFDLDVARYNTSQLELGNSPVFFDLIDDCSDQPRDVTNQYGVVIPYAHRDDSIDYRDFGLFKDKLFVNYVKDKDNMLYGLVAENPYSITVNGSESALNTMRLADATVDISRFFGTDKVFIQDKGRAAKTDGLATSYIKIKGGLNNYDVIRVYHDAGDNLDSDGRYDDIIVYSQQSAPQYLPNPGDYYFHTTHTGSPWTPNSYYVNGNIMHGRVGPLVEAISGCLNEFPKKTFEVVVIDDCIFIRSYGSSLANGEYGIKFISQAANEYDNIEIGGFTGQDLVGRLVRFSGGTDYPNRLVISGKHKQKILDNMSELRVRTVNGWSRILSVANYSDALDSDDEQAAYDDYFGNIVLVLEKKDAPDVSDGGFLIKTAAHAEFGVLSFFNVKDFDCDFYSSKYNRHPYWEYYKYLVVPAGKDMLIPGVTYIVRTDGVPGSITYNGATISLPVVGSPVPSNSYETSFVAVTGATSYSIPSNGGSPTVSYGYPYGYPDVDASLCQGAASPIRHGSMYFDKNKDMNSFDGFFAIRDSRNRTADLVGSVNDLTEYYGRFTDDIIRSEYDYYRENFAKDFAFTSKMQPSICKWGYAGGLDARDNEYRLNNHIFFGEHNFAPSHVLDIQDESKMTHEWYYLVAGYPFIKDRDTIADNYCYFEDNLDLNALLTVSGEFERYFTHVPSQAVNNEWIEIGRIQTRYSVIRYNEVIGACETFFRGAKMLFKDVLRDSSGNVIYNDATGKPEQGDSRRFDGYKFSVLLRPVKEDLDDPNQPPIRMRFIEHSEFKFILFLIELAVGYSGNVNDFITSPIELLGAPSSPVPAYGVDWLYSNHPSSRVDGDYRISFDDGVSDITYSFLYGVKNKKFGWRSNLFSTIRLATKFNYPAFTIDRAYAESMYACSNYDVNMSTDITEYGGDYFDSPYVIAALYYGDVVFNGYPLSVAQNYMTTSAGSTFAYSVSGGGWSPNPDMLSAYRQVAGGRKYYEKFMKKLSFAAISRYVNEMGPYKDKRNGMVEYETHSSSGSVAVQRDFYAEVIPPSTIPKSKAIVPELDSVVPDQFVQEREIGYEYKKGTLLRPYFIYRYGGGYEPVFRNVFMFISKYTFQYNPQLQSIFLANNVFATEMNGFGVLENFCHMKVSDTKILALQDDAKFYPAYELLNEITIGRDSFLAMHSSWDYGFHKKYVAKDRFVPVAGSLRVKEDYTYFSKVLNLPSTSYLLDYVKPTPPMEYDAKITYEPTLVADISAINVDDYCFVYSTGREDGEYVGYINLRNAMIHKFKMGGVSRKFNEFLIPSALETAREYIGYTSVDEYVTAYLTENVYDLYDVMDVYFYKRDYDDDSDRFDVEYHDDSVLLNMDWSVTKDVKINKYSRHVLSFTFKKPLNSGVTISPAIKIRLI